MIELFQAILLFALASIPILISYLKWNDDYWRKREIPWEKPTMIFGNLLDSFLGRKPMGEIFADIYRKHPGEKVVGWFKFRQPALLLRDPNLIHRILVNDFNSFRNNDIDLDEEIDPVLGRNLFVLKDERWKKNRALLTPAFTAAKIKAVFPVMKEVAEELVQFLKRHPEELHVKHAMSRYTSEIVARCAFGIDGNNFKEPISEMHEMGKLIFEPGTVRNLKNISFFVAPNVSRFLRLKMVPTKMRKFFDSILRDVIVSRQQYNVERKDFVQYLIQVKNKSLQMDDGESEIAKQTTYSDEDILAGCVMFFVEGYETSSLVLNNVLYQLAKSKKVQETLRKEIDSFLEEGELTFERLHEMPYLNAVFLESNRCLPVLFNLQKVCTERYHLDLGETKSLTVEKGTPVYLPIYALHKDPAYWEEPDSFKPERFFHGKEAEAKATGVFLPFGDGPRMCPGARIATTIVKLATVYICRQMEIEKTSKTPDVIKPDPHYFMIGHEGGIHLRFTERIP